MAALNFPANPSLNDYFVANGRRWQWNGTAWQRIPDPGAQGFQGVPGTESGSAFVRTDAGIHTLGNVGVGTTNPRYNLEVGHVGFADTALWVNGNARVTGILTVGTDSVTIDGTNGSEMVLVGAGITLYGNSGIISARSVWVNSTQIINTSGEWTGSATGLTGPQGIQGHQGVQGAAGAQGNQGHQGVQGAAGAQGNQGHQGVQGAAGAQGNQGHQGVQGAAGAQGNQGHQGVQGNQGVQGADGNFGGATFDYTFDTATADSDPGQGKLRISEGTFSGALTLFIDDEDDNGDDISSYLQTIDDSTSTLKGHFKISNKANTNDFAIFSITGSSTDGGTYFKIPATYLSGSTSFSNNEDILITFARTGDKGDAGAQGNQGHQGVQGAPGAQGVQGAAGAQGNQGHQGVQGAAGSFSSGSDATIDNLNVTGVSTFVGNAKFDTLSGSGCIVFNTSSGSGGILDDSSNHTISGSTLSTIDLILQGGMTLADEITHRSDTDTKFGFPANDTINFETAGTERLRITSGGDVGIGTIAPFGKLQVKSGTDANFVMTTASSEASLELINDAGSSNVPVNVRASEYKIKVGSTEKVRISSAGNVGINSDSPGSRLDVQATDGNGLLVAAPVLPDISLKRNGSTSATGNIDWIGSTNVVGARIGINDDVAGSMQFKLGGTGAASDTRMIITSAGNIGINTNDPSNLLHIDGGTDQLKLSDGAGSFELRAGNAFFIKDNGTSRYQIDANGNSSFGGVTPNNYSNYETVTIGGARATTGTGIDLERSDGNIYGRVFADADGLQIACNQSGDGIRFETSGGEEQVRITSNGLGIGVTNPSAPFEVTGTSTTLNDAVYAMVLTGDRNIADGAGSGLLLGGEYKTGDTETTTFAFISGLKENTTTNNNAGALSLGTRPNAGNPTQRLRISSTGGVTVTGANQASDFSEFGSNVGGLTIDDVGASHTGLRLSHGSDDTYLVQANNDNFYMSSYISGDMIFSCGTGGEEIFRLKNNGYVWFNQGNPLDSSNIVLDKADAGGAALRFYQAGSQKNYIQLGSDEHLYYYSNTGVDQIWYTEQPTSTRKMTLKADGTVLMGTQSGSYDGAFVNLELRTDSTTVGGSMTLVNATASQAGATCEIDCFQNGRGAGKIVFGRENANNWQSAAAGSASFIAFHTNNAGTVAERLRITSGGQSVFFKTANNADDLLFGYGTSAGIYAGIGGYNNFNTDQLCDLTFWTNGSTGSCAPSERMRIDSSGRTRILYTTAGGTALSTTDAGMTVQVNTTNTSSGGNNARRSFVANTPLGSANVDACALGLFDGGNFGSAISLRYNSSSSYDLGFHVADSGSQGNVSPPKIMYIKGETTDKGRLILTSACNGINFGDTISSLHTLDDYEEGTFTPVVSSSGATVAGGSVYSSYTRQLGVYTKVGDTVFVSFRVSLNSSGSAYTNGGAAGQSIYLANLPFNPSTSVSSSMNFTGCIAYVAGLSGTWSSFNIDMFVNNTSNWGHLTYMGATASTGLLTTHLTSSFDVVGNAVYKVA